MATVFLDSVAYTVYNDDDTLVAYANGSANGATLVAATEDARARYSIEATRRLNSERWISTKVSSSQELAWPRTDVNNGVTPQAILDAHMELAMLVANGVDIRTNQSATSTQLQRIKAGSVELEYFKPVGLVTEYLQHIMDLIGPYLQSNNLGTVFSWGVSRASISPSDYGFTEGTSRSG